MAILSLAVPTIEILARPSGAVRAQASRAHASAKMYL